MFTNKQIVAGVGIFVAVFGLTIMGSALLSLASGLNAFHSVPTLSEARQQTALKHLLECESVMKSKNTSTIEKISSVSMAALTMRRAFPDKPEKWDYLYGIKRELEQMRNKEIGLRVYK